MPVCSTCGAPDHLRCNCAQTPYCDQCAGNDNCNSEMDSACVFYHPTYPNQTTPVSLLTCLGLPNGSSAQTIFEAIDARLCQIANSPIIPIDSETVDLTVQADGRTLRADVKLSPDSGNILAIHTNGLFAANPNPNYLVKVDASDAPDYLFNQIVGDTNGCITIDVLNQSGLVTIRPNLDFECFAESLCAANLGVKEEIANCLLNAGLQVLDTQTVDLNLSTSTPNVLSANVKVSAAPGNSITVNSDGIFSSTTSGLTAANNGLSLSGSTVQLGGPLLHDTTISFASLYKLFLLNDPVLSIGQPTLSNIATVEMLTTRRFGGILQSSITLGNTDNEATWYAAQSVIGGTHTTPGIKGGHYGELIANSSTLITLSNSITSGYGGIVGLAVQLGSGNVTGNIISGGFFSAGFSGTGNVDSVASVRTGVATTHPGPVYTGTITNYYGIYVEDTNSSSIASTITNKFGVVIRGTHASGYNIAETAFATSSDQRIKENVRTSEYGINTIEKLRTVEYNVKGQTTKNIGFIAQEIEDVIPEAVAKVSINGYDDFRVLNYDAVFSVLVNAIKDLSSKIKVLESKIN